MHRLLHRILLFLALLLSGCAEEPVLLLQDWTLELPGNPTAIHLPTHVDGLLPNEPSTYTLSTRVSLPPAYQGKELTFAVPFLPGRSSLRVNSVPAKFLEEIDPEDYRFPNPHLFWIPPDQTQKGEIRLQLQVLMKSPWGAWLDTVPRLSATERGDRYVRAMRSWNLWANVLGMCGITVTALTHLCLFLWTREFRNRGFALVYGLTIAFPLFCLGYTQRLFGTAEAFVMGFDLVAVCMAAVHLALVVEGFQKVGRYCVGVALMTGAIYAPVINPFHGLRSGTYAVIAIVITVVVVFVWLLAKNRERRRTPALDAPSLTVDRLAFPLGVFCGLPDVLVFAGHGRWVGCWRTATFGMGVAAVVSTIGLSIQYFESRKRSILLQQSLEDRVLLLESNSKEIQALNGELRRQLAANAAELATALVRASKTGSVRQLELGEVVEGRYRVVGHLGSGGMGTVYEVERLTDQHHFAMKLLLGNYSPVSIARLAREAESALRVQCPSVVEVRDVGITDFGMLFIVMDLVEGPSLSEESSRYGDFPWAIRILSQVAEGLASIHRAGVVHRDIKPRNILLSYEGDPRHPKAQIADFGVAALGFEASAPGETPFDDHALTRTGSLVGTPLYMAPEVHGRGGDVGFPSDIFSFGVLAREILALDTGTLGVPLGLMLAARADYMPSPVFQSCPALGEELGTLLDRCILLRMEDRPTADELHEALERLRVSVTEVAAPLRGECA